MHLPTRSLIGTFARIRGSINLERDLGDRSGAPERTGGHLPMHATRGEALEPHAQIEHVQHRMTAGWVLRRALFGLALLATLMGSFAWLTYASLTAAETDPLPTSSVETADNR